MKKRYIYMLLVSFGMASAFLIKLQQGCIDYWRKQANKNRGLFLLMDQWVCLKQDGRKIERYFIKNNLKRIAIYGMSYVGKRLSKELKCSEVEVIYGIDRNASIIYSEIELVTMDADLEDVDAIVVTSVDEYDSICSMLSQKISCPIIAIEDVVNEV